MNKKTVGIIATAIAIVAIIVVGIWGIAFNNRTKDIYVSKITINSVTVGTDTYDVSDGKVMLPKELNLPTVKINYTVSTDRATNKDVSITVSPKEVATVDEENKSITFLQHESVTVLVTAKDGSEKNDSVTILFEGESETEMSATFENENVKITYTGSNKPLAEDKDNVLYVYQGVQINLSMGENVALSVGENDFVDVFEHSIIANELGEATIKFIVADADDDTAEPAEYTKTVKVIPYLNSINYGTNYRRFQRRFEDLEAANYLKTEDVAGYTVGKDSPFYFDLSLTDNHTNNLTLADVELEITAKEKGSESPVELNTVFDRVENGGVRFKSAGKTYIFTVAPKYINKSTFEFEVTVNNGINVYTHEQLKTAFADNSIREVNILADIEAVLAANEINSDDGSAKNWSNFEENHFADNGSPYKRYVVEGQPAADITINGNYFVINGDGLPYLNAKVRDDDQRKPLNTKTIGGNDVAIATVQNGVFNAQGEMDFTIKNLHIRANSAKTLIDTDDNKGEPDDVRWAKQGSGHCGIVAKDLCQVNLENVQITHAFNATLTTAGSGLSANYVNLSDFWASAVYVWDGRKHVLENTKITECGGPAIGMTDATYHTNEEVWEDFDLTLGKNVTIDNYLSGEEAWFTANNFQGAAMAVKKDLENQLKSLSKSIIKKEDDGTELFNYILQIQDDTDEKGEDGQIIEHDMSYRIKMYKGNVEGADQYVEFERKGGSFFDNNLINSTLSGTYLNAVGSYSNNASFTNLVHTVTLSISMAMTEDVPAAIKSIEDDTVKEKLGLFQQAFVVAATKYQDLKSNVQAFLMKVCNEKDLQAAVKDLMDAIKAYNEPTYSGIKDALEDFTITDLKTNSKMVALGVALSESALTETFGTNYLEVSQKVPGMGRIAMFTELFSK